MGYIRMRYRVAYMDPRNPRLFLPGLDGTGPYYRIPLLYRFRFIFGLNPGCIKL